MHGNFNETTRINVNLGKEYNIQDIKNIAEEVFGTKDIMYQNIEKYNEKISIIVNKVSDEQIQTLTDKLKETYELESTDDLITTYVVGNYRGRDIIKPYIMPLIITTIIVVAYIAIKYIKLGLIKTICTLLLRLIIAEILYLSLIAITRLSIGLWTMPVSLLIYIVVTLVTTIQYQNELEKINAEEDNK